jgi:hypothetical protein
LMKEGISDTTFYMLFVQCYLCQGVVLRSFFPQDHHCSKKSKYQHTEFGLYAAAQIEKACGEGDPTDVDSDDDGELLDELLSDVDPIW